MIKFFRLTVAAAMMAGLMSVASGAKAQSTGGVSLLDPTTAPIVGGIVEALVADSGLTGTLFFTVLNPGNIPRYRIDYRTGRTQRRNRCAQRHSRRFGVDADCVSAA